MLLNFTDLDFDLNLDLELDLDLDLQLDLNLYFSHNPDLVSTCSRF